VFALLPRLLERAGRFERGSITGIYTVLVEGDDLSDPVGDAARSILDGHIVLSRNLASRGHFPAIDVLASVSRVIDSVVPPQRAAAAASLRRLLADLAEVEELVALGAYVSGSNPALDRALARKADVLAFLRQGPGQAVAVDQTARLMAQLVEGIS
jgi:flagellar biosynthesis/type III secretory pathway ATPase